ncbi:MAG: glutaredoxin domain-containing protein [Bacteroides sp.]|jgi:glutaredoxin-like YruB-family protein|nr:glutaredoxin domain-containing protein [Bacteroides sp.]
MEQVHSHNEFLEKAKATEKAFLLLFKSDGQQSLCAFQNLQQALAEQPDAPVFTADVAKVRDIHGEYAITSVPSLLVFDHGRLSSVIKGCQDSSYYKAIAQNAIYQAKARAEGKAHKRVTVYSTPTCSWCNTLKGWLRKNNIPFTDVDVSRDEQAARTLVNRTGQQGVPQTDINGQWVVGFDQNRLKQLLEI